MTGQKLTIAQKNNVLDAISKSKTTVKLEDGFLDAFTEQKRRLRREGGSDLLMESISFQRAYHDALRQCHVQHMANLEEVLEFGKDSLLRLIQEYTERLADAKKVLKLETEWVKDRNRYEAQICFYDSAIIKLNKLLEDW